MSQLKDKSFLKLSPSSIKGHNVFMILYNYSDCDYSIVKIMDDLDNAYNYICQQEAKQCDKLNEFQMINVLRPQDVQQHFVDEHLNICYISSGNYNKFNLCEYGSISSYAIVPMVIS